MSNRYGAGMGVEVRSYQEDSNIHKSSGDVGERVETLDIGNNPKEC